MSYTIFKRCTDWEESIHVTKREVRCNITGPWYFSRNDTFVKNIFKIYLSKNFTKFVNHVTIKFRMRNTLSQERFQITLILYLDLLMRGRFRFRKDKLLNRNRFLAEKGCPIWYCRQIISHQEVQFFCFIILVSKIRTPLRMRPLPPTPH